MQQGVKTTDERGWTLRETPFPPLRSLRSLRFPQRIPCSSVSIRGDVSRSTNVFGEGAKHDTRGRVCSPWQRSGSVEQQRTQRSSGSENETRMDTNGNSSFRSMRSLHSLRFRTAISGSTRPARFRAPLARDGAAERHLKVDTDGHGWTRMETPVSVLCGLCVLCGFKLPFRVQRDPPDSGHRLHATVPQSGI